MPRERSRDRRNKEEAPVITDTTVREDCPCPRTDCKNHKLCGPCRVKHSPPKKSLPYCERGKSAQ